jgi:hypothetical protein
MSSDYSAQDLKNEILKDVKFHVDECDCVLCKALDVICEYIG